MTRPIFFLHIPKTAGTSVNDYFAGLMRCTFHIESRPDIRARLWNASDFEFVSGHIALPALTALIRREDWFLLSMLRNPVEQLISHLKWVKALGDPEQRDALAPYDERTQEVCRILHAIDLNDVDRIGALLAENQQARLFFDNCHVRYFIGHKAGPIDHSDLQLAIARSDTLDLIAFCDRAAKDARTAAARAGWPADRVSFPHANPSPLTGMPNFSDRAVLDFYRNAVRFDAGLYLHHRHKTDAAAAR